MKKLKKTVATLALVAALSTGVVWTGLADQSSNHTAVASDPVFIQKPGHVAMVSTTPEIVAAAQQLDAATQSGGPTAVQNQKIQEAV